MFTPLGDQKTNPTTLQRLYPEPCEVSLKGLFLRNHPPEGSLLNEAFIYANFISSLDGRIALAQDDQNIPELPQYLANSHDWRFFLELAAVSDAVIVSGGYMKRLSEKSEKTPPPFEGDTPEDLLAFRKQRGLPMRPALVVVSQSLVFMEAVLESRKHRRVIVATTDQAPTEAERRLQSGGIEIVRLGKNRVHGQRLATKLFDLGINSAYSIAGPKTMSTLLEARVIRRLYLTTVMRLLNGTNYTTLTEGRPLVPPYDFELAELYLDTEGPDVVQQLVQVFDRSD